MESSREMKTMAFDTEKAALAFEFADKLNNKFNNSYFFNVIILRKYVKIVRRFVNPDGSLSGASAYLFMDDKGFIYKPASTKAPAAGARNYLSAESMELIVDYADAFGYWLYKN